MACEEGREARGKYSDNVTTNVQFLFRRARDLVTDEIDRTKRLDSKAAGIVAGAVALIAAYAAFAVRLSEIQGGRQARIAWAVETSLGVIALCIAAGLAVWALVPRVMRSEVSSSEVASWSTPRVLERDPTYVVGMELRAASESVRIARERNAAKARWISCSVRVFSVAVVCMVVLTGHIAFHAASMSTRSDEPDPAEQHGEPASGRSDALDKPMFPLPAMDLELREGLHADLRE